MESQYRELKAGITDVRSHADSYHKSTKTSFVTLEASTRSMFTAYKSEFRDAFDHYREMQKLEPKWEPKWEPTFTTKLEIKDAIRKSIEDVHKSIAREKKDRLCRMRDRFFELVFFGFVGLLVVLSILVIGFSSGFKASQAESKKSNPDSDPAVDSQRFPEHGEIFPPSCEHDEH